MSASGKFPKEIKKILISVYPTTNQEQRGCNNQTKKLGSTELTAVEDIQIFLLKLCIKYNVTCSKETEKYNQNKNWFVLK